MIIAGRPPHSVGTYGSISIAPYGTGYRARTLYRDYDGVARRVERHGRTCSLTILRAQHRRPPRAKRQDKAPINAPPVGLEPTTLRFVEGAMFLVIDDCH